MSELPPPIQHLGRYDILRVLGQGAMGVVYEGRDPNLDRRVAIKTVRVVGLATQEAQEYEQRFKTEARSAGRLQHPNIVSVYDAGKHEDVMGSTAYIVMEYVEGQDLKHYLDSGKRFSLEQTAYMMNDLLAALQYAHANKIVHRDIKPANLLLTQEGRIKLTDFGVARIQDSGEATRTQGGTVGTLKYMSPEQVAGKGVDGSSDLFSTGIVLYQLLTGVRPFDGEGYLEIASKIVKSDPPAPSRLMPALPLALDRVVAKAMAKSKLDRYADAAAFAVALAQAVSNADLTITPSAASHAELMGLGEFSGGNTTNGSTVTQELELVYWKDIKDSGDAEVLEGFLKRFPGGVYADLAKRRLRRLVQTQNTSGQGTAYEATQLAAREATATAVALVPPSTDLTGLAAATGDTSAQLPANSAQEPNAEPTPARAGDVEQTRISSTYRSQTSNTKKSASTATELDLTQAPSAYNDSVYGPSTQFAPTEMMPNQAAQSKADARPSKQADKRGTEQTHEDFSHELAAKTPADIPSHFETLPSPLTENSTTRNATPSPEPTQTRVKKGKSGEVKSEASKSAKELKHTGAKSSTSTPTSSSRRKKTSARWWIGAGAALAASAGLWWAGGLGGNARVSAEKTAASVPTVTASVSAPSTPANTASQAATNPPKTTASLAAESSSSKTTESLASPSSPTANLSTATSVTTATSKITSPLRPASAAKTNPNAAPNNPRKLSPTVASSNAPATPSTPTPAPTPAPAATAERPPADAPKPAAAVAAPKPAPVAGPKEACEGKVLFSYFSCIAEQCAKSGMGGHPVCVERREMEERRRLQQEGR